MAWHDKDSWLTAALSPNLSTILITLTIAIVLPILMHSFLYKAAAATSLPTILLLGPSGGGKTAFATLVRPHYPRHFPNRDICKSIEHVQS
jgi:signal recognition particle receptor subunit beta